MWPINPWAKCLVVKKEKKRDREMAVFSELEISGARGSLAKCGPVELSTGSYR